MQLKSGTRSAARVSREAPVEYTPYGVLLPRLENSSLSGRSVDVSVDDRGLSFVTSHPLFTGRKLQVAVGGSVRSAVVRWVGAVAEGYRVGVSLDDEPLAAQRH